MHDPIIIAAPLLIAAVVIAVGFIGCDAFYGVDEVTLQPYSTAILPTSGLVSFWRLNETSGTNAADSSDGNNGTYENIAGVTLGVAGLAATDTNNFAAQFDGGTGSPSTGGGYVSIPLAPNLNPAKFTVEALVHPTAIGNDDDNDYHAIVSSRDINGGNTSGYILYLHGSSFEAWVGTGTPAWAPAVTVAAAAVADGGPYYLAMTYDGTTLTLYVNPVDAEADLTAEEFAQGTVDYTPNARSNLLIGAGANEQPAPTYCFPGVIGDVAVYKDALDFTTIQSHLSVALSGSAPQ